MSQISKTDVWRQAIPCGQFYDVDRTIIAYPILLPSVNQANVSEYAGSIAEKATCAGAATRK